MDISIEEKLDLILERLDNQEKEDPYESQETSELNKAFALASLDFPAISVNRQNPYLASGYADLHEIIRRIRPILGKNGLHISQRIKLKDSVTVLCSRLWHSSGQWIESRVLITPSKNTIEAYGSNLNSMKRFEVMNMLGITVSGDPFDDDGEDDMQIANELSEGGSQLKALYNKKEESFAVINNNEYAELMKELDDQEELTEDILDKLHIRSLRELPSTRFAPTINRIRAIKKKRRG